jgi:bacteriocin biosynthesis cyclodehydratase domain-containing protein
MIVVFSEGEFGRAVAADLARKESVREHSLVASRGEFDEAIEGADFVALALWRRYDRLAEEVGKSCSRAGLAWSSVFQSDHHLFCGPLVVPPEGPCYRCFCRRHLVHHLGADRELAVLRAYDKDYALGVEGFLPPSVGLAAAALLNDARSLTRGRLRRIDLLTGELVDTRVSRLHGCELCGGGEPTNGPQRFVRYLVPAVREILG